MTPDPVICVCRLVIDFFSYPYLVSSFCCTLCCYLFFSFCTTFQFTTCSLVSYSHFNTVNKSLHSLQFVIGSYRLISWSSIVLSLKRQEKIIFMQYSFMEKQNKTKKYLTIAIIITKLVSLFIYSREKASDSYNTWKSG